MASTWNLYKNMLGRYPLATKSVTACLLMSFSDVLCQNVQQKQQSVKENRSIVESHKHSSNSKYQYDHRQILSGNLRNSCIATSSIQSSSLDWKRTLQVGITGLTFTGPISHYWYAVLERIVKRVFPRGGGTIRVVTAKLFLDALFFTPLAIGGYFIWRTVLENPMNAANELNVIRNKLESKWTSGVIASWSFWPAANVM